MICGADDVRQLGLKGGPKITCKEVEVVDEHLTGLHLDRKYEIFEMD